MIRRRTITSTNVRPQIFIVLVSTSCSTRSPTKEPAGIHGGLRAIQGGCTLECIGDRHPTSENINNRRNERENPKR